jgi:hypothetical protein
VHMPHSCTHPRTHIEPAYPADAMPCAPRLYHLTPQPASPVVSLPPCLAAAVMPSTLRAAGCSSLTWCAPPQPIRRTSLPHILASHRRPTSPPHLVALHLPRVTCPPRTARHRRALSLPHIATQNNSAVLAATSRCPPDGRALSIGCVCDVAGLARYGGRRRAAARALSEALPMLGPCRARRGRCGPLHAHVGGRLEDVGRHVQVDGGDVLLGEGRQHRREEGGGE